jgi:hypothetical protein
MHPPFDPHWSGTLDVNPHGRLSGHSMFSTNVICFCDIPADFDQPGRLERAHLETISGHRAAAAFDNVTRAAHFDEMVPRCWQYFEKAMHEIQRAVAEERPVPEGLDAPRLQRFLAFYVLSFLKFFDSKLSDDDPDNFYMERERRIMGNLEFTLADVCRILVPRELEERLRGVVRDYQGEIRAL